MNKKKNKKIKLKKSDKVSFFSTQWWTRKLRWSVAQPVKWLWTWLTVFFAIAVVILAAFFVPATNRRYSSSDYRSYTSIVIHYNADNSKYQNSSSSTPNGSDIVTEVRAELAYLLNYGPTKNAFSTNDYSVTSNADLQEVIVSGSSKILNIFGSFNQLLANNNKITITTDTGGALYAGAINPLASKWKDPNPNITGNDFFVGNNNDLKLNIQQDAGKFYKKRLEGNVFKSAASTANGSGNGYILNLTLANTDMFKSFTKYLYDYLLLKADNKNPYDPTKPSSSKAENFRLYIWLNLNQFLQGHNMTLANFNAYNYCFTGAGNWDKTDPTNTHVNPAALPVVWDGFQSNYKPSGLLGVYTVSNTSPFSSGISSSTINFKNSPVSGSSYNTHHYASVFSEQSGSYFQLFTNNALGNYNYYAESAANFPPRLGKDSFVFWMYALSFLIVSLLFAIFLVVRMRLWGLFASALLAMFAGVMVSILIYSNVQWLAVIILALFGSLMLMMYMILMYASRLKRAYKINQGNVSGVWHESRSRRTWLRIADVTVFGLILADVFFIISQSSLRYMAFFFIAALALSYVLVFVGLQLFTSTALTSPWFKKRMHLLGLEPWLRSNRLAAQKTRQIDDAVVESENATQEYDRLMHGKSRWGFLRNKFNFKFPFNKALVKQNAINIDTAEPVSVLKKPNWLGRWFPILAAIFVAIAVTLGSLFATILGPLNGNSDFYGKTEYYFTNISLSQISKDSKAIVTLENDINQRLSDKFYPYTITFGHYGSTNTEPNKPLIDNALILTVEGNKTVANDLKDYFNHLDDLKANNLVFQNDRYLQPNSNVPLNINQAILAITYSVLALAGYLIIRFSVAGALAFLFGGSFSVIGTIFVILASHIFLSYAVLAAIFIAIFLAFGFLIHILGRVKAYLKAWGKKNPNQVISFKEILSIFFSVIKKDALLILTTFAFIVIGIVLILILVPHTVWFGITLIACLIMMMGLLFGFLPAIFALFVHFESMIKQKYKAKARKNEVAPEEEILQGMNEISNH